MMQQPPREEVLDRLRNHTLVPVATSATHANSATHACTSQQPLLIHQGFYREVCFM